MINPPKGIAGHVLIVLLVYGYACSNTPNPKFEHIGPEQGLTASSVLCILQDHQGFIWFGTEDGLFRHDGYGMTEYRNDPLDSTSLGNNNVFALLEDHNGTLWIGTAGGGLNRYDRDTERFTQFKHDPANPHSLSADVVSALYEDRDGVLWLGTWAGLNSLDPENGRITPYINDVNDTTSINPHWIRTICEDRFGQIWVGTDGGISRLDRETGKFTHFVEIRNYPHSLSSNAVKAIIKDRSGTIWIGSWAGLDRFDHKSQRFTNLRTEGKVSSIVEDRSGELWIGTDNNLLHLDKTAHRFMRFVHDPVYSYSLSSNHIQAIYEDRTGTLWLGTGKGVNRYDPRQFRFQQFVYDPDNDNNIGHKDVIAIHEDRSGTIWIATAERMADRFEIGLDKFNRNTGRTEHIFANRGKDDVWRRLWIYDIHQDRSGMVWLGTNGGLGRYDPETDELTRFVHDPHNPYSLRGNMVWQIQEDRSGRLWVAIHTNGSATGIDYFDRESQQFKYIELVPEASSGMNQRNGVFSISEGQTGRLWFSTMNYGIFLLNPGSDEFIQYNHAPGNPNSLSHGWVGPVYEDRMGMVWAAPWYGGLNKLDPETGQVTIYTEKHGLGSNYITSILEDDNGCIWSTTLNGLSRFDPQSGIFKNFNQADGLINTGYGMWNFNMRSRTGELFFGGEKGIDFVHPDSIRDNKHIPPVVFTGFTRYNSNESNGKIIIEKGISEKTHFELNYQDHTLHFEFAALNFRNPDKNQYAYKLEGFSDNWTNIGNKHDVIFTNLDPGEYTLRVRGSNNDGIWNEAGASLVITVSPPWWKTGWAYTLYIAFVGLTLYGIRRYELKRTHLKNELEKKDFESRKLTEIDEMKSRIFADISHEFRTPLTLILGPLEKIRTAIRDTERQEDISIVQRNAARLRRLVDQLLDLSRIEAKRMPLRARPNDLIKGIREWVASFASVAESKNILLNLNIPEMPVIVYFDSEKLEKIVYNLLSNAFKFTPEGGSVSVAVEHSGDNQVQITVSDTGIGISQEDREKIFERFYRANNVLTGEQGGTGIGLALVKEFVELHHGRISVESEPGAGSTFIISLPMGSEHLSVDEIIRDGEIEKQPAAIPELIIANDSDSMPESENKNDRNKQPEVLVVEDNIDMHTYIRNCLSERYNIRHAKNGRDGLHIAIEKFPDLIISDVMMPEMDGFVLCQNLKTDRRTSHIPIILLTARASRESKIEGLETGADDYLTKPFDVKELEVRVKNLIEQRRRLQKRFRREITVQPKDITVTSIDEQFLQQAIEIAEANIPNNAFDVDQFCEEMAMSRSTLNRKLRALTGSSTNEFIRLLRLKRASQLLQKNSATIVEIAYQVGFNNPSYFAECFREQFGKSPSQFSSGDGQ